MRYRETWPGGDCRDGATIAANAHLRGGPVITAIVLINAVAERIPDAAQAIADIEGVSEVYSCAGDVDLVAVVRVAAHEDLADLIPAKIGKVAGVLDTVT